MVGRGFVIDVAVGTGEKAFCAEGGEAFVEFAAGPAEVGIIFVAEREDGIAERFEAWGVFGVERFEKFGRVVGWFAVAPRAGNEKEARSGAEHFEGDRIQLFDLGGETVLGGFFGDAFGDLFGGAGLATEADEERLGFFRQGRGRLSFGAVRVREKANEVAVEPCTLLRREWRAAGNEWNIAAHFFSARKFVFAGGAPAGTGEAPVLPHCSWIPNGQVRFR